MTRQFASQPVHHSRGHHEASWRHRRLPLALTDIRYYQDLTQRAGARCSTPSSSPTSSRSARRARRRALARTLTVLAAVRGDKRSDDATCSTTYTEPFNLARQFGSLDHISNGRVAGHPSLVLLPRRRPTSAAPANDHADRFSPWRGVMASLTRCGTVGPKTPMIDDRARGAMRARPHPADQPQGRNYQVAGPLNLPRTPQGRRCWCRRDRPTPAAAFTARHAEAVSPPIWRRRRRRAFYADLKALVATEGRAPDQVLICLISPMIRPPRRGQRLAREVNELATPRSGASGSPAVSAGHDFSHVSWNRPLTPEDFPAPSSVEAARSRTEVILSLVRREQATLRQLLASLAGARGHFTAAARRSNRDIIEDWFIDGAADGFKHHARCCRRCSTFSARGDPLLQPRGLFRHRLCGQDAARALRLDWPKSAFKEAALQAT